MAYNNYYPEPDDQSQVGGDNEGGEDAEGKKDMGVTALLPKTILAGKKFEPGEEVVLKIVHDHGDEIEVAYAPEKKGEEDDEGEEGGDDGEDGSEMDGAMGKLNAMAE